MTTKASPSSSPAYRPTQHVHTWFSCDTVASGMGAFGKYFHNMSLCLIRPLLPPFPRPLNPLLFPLLSLLESNPFFKQHTYFGRHRAFFPPSTVSTFCFFCTSFVFDTTLGMSRQTGEAWGGEVTEAFVQLFRLNVNL